MEKFYTMFSFFILFAVIMTITSFNPIHSVFWLVLVFILSANLLVMMKFDFLGLILIIIYVGAIAILFLFVIMMLDIYQLSKVLNIYHIFPLIILLISQIYFFSFKELNYDFYVLGEVNWDFVSKSQIDSISQVLYGEYALSFIIISILLLIAMIGAIVLTLENSILTRRQYLSLQHHRNNSWT